MDEAQWFRDQLRSSADGFTWAVEQVPPERRRTAPPENLGEWPAIRHAYHMLSYERDIALPSMRQWLGGPKIEDEGFDDDSAWEREQDLDSILARFRQVRAEQIALLAQFDPSHWGETRDTGWTRPEPWGGITLRWVVTKTYQHTAEHTHDLLRLVLFWDFYAAKAREHSDAAAGE